MNLRMLTSTPPLLIFNFPESAPEQELCLVMFIRLSTWIYPSLGAGLQEKFLQELSPLLLSWKSGVNGKLFSQLCCN